MKSNFINWTINYIKTHKYEEIQLSKILSFITMLIVTNLIILYVAGVYMFHFNDIYYTIFSIILLTITISLPEKFIARKYGIYVDLNGRINWLYSEVITFGISLLAIPLIIPIIKSARYCRCRKKLASLKKGEISNRERSEIFLLNIFVILAVAFFFMLLFNTYSILVYADASTFLFSMVLISMVPYKYFDGILLFYHNKFMYLLLILLLLIMVAILPFNFIAAFILYIAFILITLLLMYLKLF